MNIEVSQASTGGEIGTSASSESKNAGVGEKSLASWTGSVSLSETRAKGESNPPKQSGIEEMIAQTFPEDPSTAIAVAKAESRENPQAVGDLDKAWGDGRNGMSCGIYQIRIFPNRPDCETLKDIKINLQEARKIYEKVGWSAWSTYKNKQYLAYE